MTDLIQTESSSISSRIKQGIKSILRHTIYPYLKFPYHRFHIWRMKKLIKRKGERAIVSEEFTRQYGFKPDLDNPRTFNEKIAWMKINMHDPIMVKCADKYLVREYVKETIGEQYLIPLLGVYKHPREIPFDDLPVPFVMKVNHASGGNVFCFDKNAFDKKEAIRILKHHLKINAYYYGCEWAYRDIPPRIICEKVLFDADNHIPKDYKFLCFNGEPLLIHVDIDRFGDHRRNFYDTQWNLLPVKLVKKNSDKEVLRPSCLEEMVQVARKMSRPFDFVRVDLYDICGKVYAGEMTFYPHGGSGPFTPHQYEIEYGDKLHLKGLSGDDAKSN